MCDCCEYENMRRITYGYGTSFIPVCEKCCRFIKADKSIMFNFDGAFDQEKPNATCKKCGRTKMLFEGYI